MKRVVSEVIRMLICVSLTYISMWLFDMPKWTLPIMLTLFVIDFKEVDK
jgi:hypothetical protein